MYKKPAFYIDMNRCSGCKTCMIACLDKYDLPTGVHYRRVREYVGGHWREDQDKTVRQSVFVYNITMACNHCEDPACVNACPTTAMHIDKNGIVVVDQRKCIGCRYCEWVCPYSAPQFNVELKKMNKCDFCRDYLIQGQDPACVAACPTRALHIGEYDDLIEKYGDTMIAPLPERSVTKPHLVITPHRNGRPVNSQEGVITNPEEG